LSPSSTETTHSPEDGKSEDIKWADREGRYRENAGTSIEIDNIEKRKRKFEEVKSEVENNMSEEDDAAKGVRAATPLPPRTWRQYLTLRPEIAAILAFVVVVAVLGIVARHTIAFQVSDSFSGLAHHPCIFEHKVQAHSIHYVQVNAFTFSSEFTYFRVNSG
jgi:hypothetical protein